MSEYPTPWRVEDRGPGTHNPRYVIVRDEMVPTKIHLAELADERTAENLAGLLNERWTA